VTVEPSDRQTDVGSPRREQIANEPLGSVPWLRNAMRTVSYIVTCLLDVHSSEERNVF
jgi:hypothetical protein